jgi:hypothetical protein
MEMFGIPTELILQGLVGLLLAGAAYREYSRARASVKPQDPIITAVGIGWSAAQVERVIQALETIAAAASTYDGTVKDSAQQTIKRLLERLDEVEEHFVDSRMNRDRDR